MAQKLVVFLLLVTLSNSYVYSLRTESIVGGIRADEDGFKYQAALNVLLNHDETESLMLCAAVIIHKQFILTAANCVVKTTPVPLHGLFFKRWYIITSGTKDFKKQNALFDEIEEIFVPEQYNPYTRLADLAVLKLKEEIDFKEYPQLKIAELPDESTIDENILHANVSGFGYNVIYANGSGLSDYELKYLKVNITTIEECQEITTLRSDKYLCAKSIPDNPGNRSGICRGDVGAPLVYDGKLLGLAIVVLPNCLDTVLPTLYTRIKPYTQFIRNIIAGRPRLGTRRYVNPFPLQSPSEYVQ